MSKEEFQEIESEDLYIVQPRTFISETVAWSARNGNVDAMYIMGEFFLGHYKCLYDPKKAFYWLKKAAYQHHVDATYEVGHCYEFGVGVERNDTEAMRWYHEAGRLHYYLAEKKLAFCYSTGKLGCYPDFNNAEKWHDNYMKNPRREFFENKERWNIPRELLEAGYTSESGVFKGERYLVNAVKFAANRDIINGKYCLALLYTSGFGGKDVLEKDKSKAIEIFEELVNEHEHPESMYCLAKLYEEGQCDGSQPNSYMALKLYKEAARHGERSAKRVLRELKSMPMDADSRAIKNDIKKREYLKQQQQGSIISYNSYNRKNNYMKKKKVRTVLAFRNNCNFVDFN